MKGKVYYAVILLVTFLLFFWTNVQTAFFFLIPMVLLVPVSILLNWWTARQLGVRVLVERNMQTGEPGLLNLKLQVQNHSYLPAFHVTFQGAVKNLLAGTEEPLYYDTSIAPKGRKEFVFSLRSDYCGRIDGDVVSVRAYDFLGLASHKISYQCEGNCYIYPAVVYSDVAEICKHLQEELDIADRYMNRKGNDITEILDIRDYQKGDNIKNIHWKLSKKLGHKVVRELDMPANQDIILLFALSPVNQPDPAWRDRIARTVVGVIEELLQVQMNLDAVLFAENETRLGTYSIEGNESKEWYEHILLDGDISFDPKCVDRYIQNHHILGRYSSVILVTDGELDLGYDAPNLIQITPDE